jgi:uncharacterized protein (TIGR01777 family)
MLHFTQSSRLNVPPEEAFAWHARAGALQRLNPPWERVQILAQEALALGTGVTLGLQMGPLRLRWVARHTQFSPPHYFQDIQVQGPFRFWKHHHHLETTTEGSQLRDVVDYQIPFAPLSHPFAKPFIEQKLTRMFAYRHRITAQDLAFHHHYFTQGVQPMQIVISGASGLIGQQLVAFLSTGGHKVRRLVRQVNTDADTIFWDPVHGNIEAEALEGVDAVIHLAGETIGERWDEAKKARILNSRIQGTSFLAQTLAELERPPKVFVSASASGYYGAHGQELLNENSPAGNDFLAQVCQQWEQAADPARARMRVVHPRLGVVLTPAGGALEKMLLPFQMGLGGPIGNGQQYMSWIALDDVLRGIMHCVVTESLVGPVNLVAPTPVTNRVFTQTLGKVLHRPTLIPIPALGIRALFGEMGEALLLQGSRIEPQRLSTSGFVFQYPDLEGALRHLLGHS